jgi:hypothetical protein
VRDSKKDGEKIVADPTAFTAVTVKHSGEEEAFALPANGAAKSYLDAAAKAFFGETASPAPVTLAFDPSGAKAAVSTKGGNNAGAPKTKPEFVKALLALPAYEGKEAELNKKKLNELKKLWEEAKPKSGDAPVTSEASTDVEDSATGDDDGES